MFVCVCVCFVCLGVTCDSVVSNIIIPQPQFKSIMLYQFLHLLLQVLIQRSHGLLQEEICCCMYNMAAVDFNLFHTRFMSDFLQRCEGITAEQRVEIASNYNPDEVRVLHSIHTYVHICIHSYVRALELCDTIDITWYRDTQWVLNYSNLWHRRYRLCNLAK